MSVPAWKQAILDRKKKQENEQKKKEDDEAAYLASLPPWKRAIVMKQRDKTPPSSANSTLERNGSFTKTTPAASNEPSPAVTPSNKWMTAVKNVREGSPKTANRPAWAKTEPARTTLTKPAQQKSSPSTTRSHNFAGTKTTQATSRWGNAKPTSTPTSTPSQSVPRMGRRESVTVLPDSNMAVKKPLATPATTGGVSLRSGQNKPVVHVSDKRRSFEGDEEDDTKLAAMPAWKKALIMRRRAAAAQESKEPKLQPNREPPAPVKEVERPIEEVKEIPIEMPKEDDIRFHRNHDIVSQPKTVNTSYDETDSPHVPVDTRLSQEDSYTKPTATVKKPSTRKVKTTEKKQTSSQNVPKKEEKKSSSTGKSPTTKPPSKKTPPINSRVKTKPEIVNRPQAESQGPSKLVEKEGVVHRPPIYKEVDEWANVGEDDPAFTKLPMWKQALIKRRRTDIAKRSGSFTAEPSNSPQQQRSSATGTQNLPAWKADLLKKRDSNKSMNIERDLMQRTGGNHTAASSQPVTTNKNIKNLAGRFGSNTPVNSNQTSHGTERLQPVRKAPIRPAPVRSAPSPPTKKEEEEPEPMFTYSFKKKHRTLDAGSESSDSSDSDLEDVTLTNLDDSSDEDDSGIDKGGIVVMSYKTTNNDYTPPLSPVDVLSPASSNTSSVPNGGHNKERRDSKSILIDPASRPNRGLRRVSFSDSNLTVEHFYPKYIYHDYDDINSDDEDQQGFKLPRSTSENSGLSQKLHPYLRPTNETDSDVYRYSPSKASPMKPSSNNKLGQYTPSIMSTYNDNLQNHISGSLYPHSSPAKSPEKAQEEPDYNSPVNDRANDFYSHLNTDTAALLW